MTGADQTPLVTIVVPNWNTGELLRLCIASVQRFTRVPHRLVVVDNGSTDASRATAEAAEASGTIDLIRRDDDKGEGAPSHAAALDAGLDATTTPFMLALDSDAWARREGWLRRFVDAIGDDASHAGSTKFPSGRINRLSKWLIGKKQGPEARYVRPCHAIYRVDVLREHGLSFAPTQTSDGRWRTTGQTLHERLVELGQRPVFIPHAEMERIVGHIRHATSVINAHHFTTIRLKARLKGERQIRRLLASREVKEILAGSSLP